MPILDPYVTATELRDLVASGEVRPREVADFFLRRIDELNPKLSAFMTVTPERAIEDATRLEKRKPSRLPLYGVAYSLKDLTWTKGIRTTFGSRNFADFVPDADAELADRLRNAGGILLGKTTTPEFGGRPTTEGGLCPPARNPWNTEHTAGGSSGGAAVGVAVGMHPIAEGSDGGGSVRIPAACCGVFAIKPSRGRISLAPGYGEVWGGLFTNGPIARTVQDAALMLDVMAGPVPGDPYWAAPPSRRFVASADRRPKGLRLATLAKSALGPVDADTVRAFESACHVFEELGHELEPVDLDPAALLVESFGKVVGANLAAVPFADPELIDPVVRVFYEAGRKTSAGEYVNAMAEMHNRSREVVQKLLSYDALLTPTLSRPAMRIGTLPSKLESYVDEALAWLPFTFPFNATGQPACSLPNGFSSDGLPIGLQIVGRPQDEPMIISLAAAFEEARPWRNRKPPV
ncbi:MAG: amidase [Candidatus Binatota bacterium]|nr:amidase [Candidatus Binatota bacterium]